MAQGSATHSSSISGLNSHLSEPEKALSHRCLSKDRLFISMSIYVKQVISPHIVTHTCIIVW